MTSLISKINNQFTPSNHPNIPLPRINVVKGYGKYRISFNPSVADFGVETTAIVLAGAVFFILKGDHALELDAVAKENGLEGCIDYFIAHKDEIHENSEHAMACRLNDDLFELNPIALSVMGDELMWKLVQAFA